LRREEQRPVDHFPDSLPGHGRLQGWWRVDRSLTVLTPARAPATSTRESAGGSMSIGALS
jgi:hypothetical protein